jgi:hypothetical protein
MKRLFKFGMFLAVLIFISCSPQKRAQMHLKRALKLDSTILVQKADTTEVETIEYRQVSILVKDTIQFSFTSDTAYLDTLLTTEKINIDPFTIYSNDSVAFAKIWIKNGRLFANVWAEIDTAINWQDSIQYYQKQITKEREIRRRTEVEITEIESTLKQIQRWIIIAAVILLILVIIRWIIKSQYRKF